MTVLSPLIDRPALARRRLTRAQVAAVNRLARRVAPFVLKATGTQLSAALIGPIPSVEGAPWVHLRVDGAPVAAQVAWGNLRRVVGMPVEGLPGDEAALLLEDALAPWLDEIETVTGLSLRFVTVSEQPPEDCVLRGWGVQGQSGARSPIRQAGALLASIDAAEVLGRALAPLSVARTELAGLSLRVQAELDGTVLHLAELRSLQPGDALLIEDDNGQARLVLEDQFAAPARRESGGWRLAGPFRPRPKYPFTTFSKGIQMTQDPDPARETPPAVEPSAPTPALPDAPSGRGEGGLDDLEIRLSFRLGETLIDLAELRALAPGAIVTLDRPDGALVEILANGRRIGTGEVIAVGGQRAVEIRSLFADG